MIVPRAGLVGWVEAASCRGRANEVAAETQQPRSENVEAKSLGLARPRDQISIGDTWAALYPTYGVVPAAAMEFKS